MADYDARFNRLALSAADLKSLTAGQKPGEPWSDALIEDYLNILRDLIELADLIEANALEIFNSLSDLRQLEAQDSARIAKLYGMAGVTRNLIQELEDYIDALIETKQTKLTWRDQGVDLTTAGTAIRIDFIGAGVTATYTSGTVTVDIPGGSGGGSSPIISWAI